jgi:amino acid adenylation domain-containing protein
MTREEEQGRCLHHLVEAQARRTPDALALRFERQALSYRVLDQRASWLARHLARLGAGPDMPVGLLAERSPELLIGILGILKAGGAYLPIDPSYPGERIAFMCADARLRLVLTQSALAAKLPAGPRAVALDMLEWLECEEEGPALDVRPEHLAYVIYTSGSTGCPKGVGIEHRNIVHYVRDIVERLRLEPGMNYATVSTIAADLGHTVIYPALATGGCLHIVSQERAQSPVLLAEYFARERIDVLKIVPSHLAALQAGRHPGEVMPRRRLILGGEASRLAWVEQLRSLASRSLAPDFEIHNHYGPTETTVGVLTYALGAAAPSTPSGTLPLGQPLPHSRAYVLDADGRPVPAGEKGELFIGGAGVGRGYLDRPELTAERFVPDPFSPEPGARMYRTGDLARRLPDGNLEFCGRVDHQVKLHGYRVELGEIEAALRDHESVQEAVVILREEVSGGGRLVACVVPKDSRAAASPAAWREFLRERLPQYMLPSAFALMERLPLTANGKVDRQALAAASLDVAEGAGADGAPESATQRALAAIWSELLNTKRIGIHDDVFDLGAHSLVAMKALARIRDAFDVRLSMRNLFEHPTIAGLAGMIDEAREREEIAL